MMDCPDPQDGALDRDLDTVNVALSEWAARSAAQSEALIERFEAMGYEVRGRSEAEIAEILRHPPARPPR